MSSRARFFEILRGRTRPPFRAAAPLLVSAVILLVVVFGSATAVSAQTVTGAILGTVTDNTGAVMPGVTVTATNPDTGFSRSEVSDEKGFYQLRQLPIGPYDLVAELQGFKKSVRKLQLTVGAEALVNLSMEVGGVEETVVVTAEAAIVQTNSSEVGALVDQKMIQDLPLNARDVQQLAVLQPGVQSQGAYNASYGMNITVRGSRPEQNRFLLNGVDASTAFGTSPVSAANIMIGVEGLQEFKVLTSDYSAAYGIKAGGVITMVTKGGTNDFHGSAYEYHRDAAWDSINYFDKLAGKTDNPPFKRDQFGASIGGPIKKGKTFFFVNYEQFRHRLGLTNRTNTLSAQQRAGYTLNQATGQWEFVGIQPRMIPYMNVIPLGNGPMNSDGTQIYTSNPLESINEKYITARIDHSIGSNNQLWGVYTGDWSTALTPRPNDNFAYKGQKDKYIISVENAHTFSATLLNSTRFGYNHNFVFDLPFNLIPINDSLYLIPDPYYTPAGKEAGQYPAMDVAGIDGGGSADGPRWVVRRAISFDTEFNYLKGIHSMKFGFGYNHAQDDGSYSDNDFRGRVAFATIPDFQRGIATSINLVLPGSNGRRVYQAPQVSTYFEDTLRAAANLTLTLGLRYEALTKIGEKYGQTANLREGPLDPKSDVGSPLLIPEKSNFAPRVGINWDPFGDGKTSIRGGGGIFYSQIATYSLQETSNNTPVTTQVQLLNVPFPDVWSGVTANTLPAIGAVSYRPKTAHLYSYHASVQRELGNRMSATLSYVGSKGRNLPSGNIVANNFGNRRMGVQTADGRWYFDPTLPRPNPNFSQIGYNEWKYTSHYNSLQASVARRPAQGFGFGVNYSWTSCWDQTSGENNRALTNTAAGTVIQYSRDANSGYGPCSYTSEHAASISTNWDLPGQDLKGVAGAFLGGWRWATISTIQTGVPFNVLVGFGRATQAPGTGSLGERPDWAPGCSADNAIKGTVNMWFDPACFALPPVSTTGLVPSRILRGPNFFTTDWSFSKSFNFGASGKRLDFELQVFNLTNRANFRTPNASLWRNATTRRAEAGTITSTVSAARQLQLGIKFVF